jgi:hypothetical protein
MDALYALPVWAQLLIAFLVAGVLIAMNVGWLIQARGWLQRQGQRQRGDSTGGVASSPTTMGKRDRA